MVLSILGITGILSFISQTFAASGNGAFARSDYYYPEINATLTTDTSNGVLANDYSVPSTTLYAYLDSWVQHWSLTLSTNWTFTYTPDTNYNGMDYFWYHAGNENYNSATTRVSIQVGAPETAPVAGDDNYSTDRNTNFTLTDDTIMTNDSDAESDPITAILNTQPFNWEVTLHSDWTFTYTPDAYFEGHDFFTYYLSDGKMTGNVATVWIDINSVDDTDDPNTITIPDSDNPNTVETAFTTKNYSKGTWALQSLSDNSTLVGNKRVNFSISNGQILVPLDMQSVSSTDKVEAIIPAGTIATKAGFGTNFSWIMNPPRMERTRLATEKWWLAGNVVSVVSFGNNSEGSIAFKDSWNNNVDVTIKIPAPWLRAWDLVHIFYSNDFGYNWNEHAQNPYANVINIWGKPYVVTTTTHFTYFAIVWSTWSFVINDDDPSTTTSDVTLTIDLPVAANMRFSNDNSTWSDWEPYDTYKSRTLPWTYWSKTIYAEFDLDEDTIADLSTSDTIEYSAWDTPHWNTTGNVRLEITTTSGTCVYGTSLYIGSHTAQFNAYDMTGNNFSSAFYCSDTEGIDIWTMTMQATSPLSDGNPNHDIPADNVSMIASSNYVDIGSCVTGQNDASWVNIGAAPGTILYKNDVNGSICTIKSDTVNLAVHIPDNQAVGVYSGTLTLNMPF